MKNEFGSEKVSTEDMKTTKWLNRFLTMTLVLVCNTGSSELFSYLFKLNNIQNRRLVSKEIQGSVIKLDENSLLTNTHLDVQIPDMANYAGETTENDLRVYIQNLESNPNKLEEIAKKAYFKNRESLIQYLAQNPKIFVRLSHSSKYPYNAKNLNDKNGHVENSERTEIIPIQFLFYADNKIFYLTKTNPNSPIYPIHGSSGSDIYDLNGNLIALHNSSPVFFGNRYFLDDIINPDLFDLDDFAKEKSLGKVFEKFRNKLSSLKGLDTKHSRAYFVIITKYFDVIYYEILTKKHSVTLEILKSRNLDKIINHGINLHLAEINKQYSFTYFNDSGRHFNDYSNLINKNRAMLVQLTKERYIISTATPVTSNDILALKKKSSY